MLLVQPSEVVFSGVRPGLLYVLQLKITNKGTSMCRVRIKPLVSPNFRLNYTPTGSLAPGLDVTAEVEFQLPEGEPALEAAGDVEIGFKEVLHVITNGEVIDVPLRAIRPTADVRVADHLDFGLVVVNTRVVRELVVSNVGTAAGGYKLELPQGDLPLSATPAAGRVGAGSMPHGLLLHDGDELDAADAAERDLPADALVSVAIEPSELGPFRAMATFDADGLGERRRPLDISAQIVEQRLNVIVPPESSGKPEKVRAAPRPARALARSSALSDALGI